MNYRKVSLLQTLLLSTALLLTACASQTPPAAELQVVDFSPEIPDGFTYADGSRPLTFPADFGVMNLPLPRTTGEAFPASVEFLHSFRGKGAQRSSIAARQVGSKAKELFALPEFAGRVLAVLSGTIYLSVQDGEVLWICPEGSPLHRRGILVSRSPLVTPGEKCFAEVAGLTFDGGPCVAFDGATEWIPHGLGSEDAASLVRVRARFRQLLAVLGLLEIPDGLGPSIFLVSALARRRALPSFPPGSLLERVKDRVWDLAQCCRRQDLRSVTLRAREVAGLGPGLTPSGDDFLGGLFFALHFLHLSYPATFPRAAEVSGLLDWARSRTHPVSHAIFSDLAMGHGPGPLHELAGNLVRGREGPVQSVDAAVRVSRIGHSSGWDMLAGFLTGMLMVEFKE